MVNLYSCSHVNLKALVNEHFIHNRDKNSVCSPLERDVCVMSHKKYTSTKLLVH